MADPADRASMDADVLTSATIAGIRAVAGAPALRKPKGRCYWCDEKVGPGEIFCDADCKEDFDKAARAKSLNIKG